MQVVYTLRNETTIRSGVQPATGMNSVLSWTETVWRITHLCELGYDRGRLKRIDCGEVLPLFSVVANAMLENSAGQVDRDVVAATCVDKQWRCHYSRAALAHVQLLLAWHECTDEICR
jgi:hypothetical protein